MGGQLHDMMRRAPTYVRAMGYTGGIRRLYARGRRCRRAWAAHVEQSRALILEAARACNRCDRVLVIGSGPLHDVPVAQLSWRFREVVLADIVHLGRVRFKLRHYDNVSFATVDVTGMAEVIYHWARSGREGPPPEHAPLAFAGEAFDLVVSCNVLSQLPLNIVRYAKRMRRAAALADEGEFSRRIVARHLDWLASQEGRICLITDTHQRHRADGRIVCSKSILWDIALPAGGRRWCWELAPRSEIYKDYDVQHCVVGYVQFPKEAWLNPQGAPAPRQLREPTV